MIIIGLGNPGQNYDGTRHNLGFAVMDALQKTLAGTPWKKERDVLVSTVGDHLLVKPQSFMNLSGTALRDYFQYKHLAPAATDIMVVHDDVDFPVGTVKEDRDRSSGGHQGIQNIIEQLGTQAFDRLRLGVGSNRPLGIPAEDYVLQRPASDEQAGIAHSIAEAVAILQRRLE